ncbi:glycosyltransferase [Pseudoalteromonas sp. NJ631]|uniref:glycosyltransferase n=1 Tax=Pseudoalteromonas sp. NJ631 TaxID=493915 RepID=UPI0003017944|nr:glycosyltransferase [Pseudoalteromonas sp. NJ631]
MLLINFIRVIPGGNFVYTYNLIKYIANSSFWSGKVILAISSANLEGIDFDISNLRVEVVDVEGGLFSTILSERKSIKKIYKKYKCEVKCYLSPNTLFPFYHFPKVKMVSVIHDLNFVELKVPLAKKIYKYLLYNYTALVADKLICISQFTQNVLENTVLPKIQRKSIVVYNGVQVPPATTCNEQPLTEKAYALSFGHQEHKNLNGSIELIKSYNKSNPEARLRLKVIGSSHAIEDLKMKEYSFIDFLGRVSDEEVELYLKNAKFLVFLSDYEGFGLPVFEAFASKTAVIISAQQALVEIASGHAFVNENCENTVSYMEKILSDDAEYNLVVESAFDYVSNYTWNETFNVILDLNIKNYLFESAC